MRGEHTVAQSLALSLEELGVRHAFGVSGGAISFFWSALGGTGIRVTHFRHESGAAFAACEASIAAAQPVVVFVTSGPGLTNVLTGIYAARHECAHVILVSAHTDPGMDGRRPIQETSPRTLPTGVFTAGPLFDYAVTVDTAQQLPEVVESLAAGLARPNGFVAHVSLSPSVQPERAPKPRPGTSPSPHDRQFDVVRRQAADVHRLLSGDSWLMWVGGGARTGAESVRRLAAVTGVPVMATPRGKGVIAETDPGYLGVTGFAGHPSVQAYLQRNRPAYILVLGASLGDFGSGYLPAYLPRTAFVHVDIDPDVPGRAFPDAATMPVTAQVGAFCDALSPLFGSHASARPSLGIRPFDRRPASPSRPVDPVQAMAAVQAVLVDAGVPVLAETGNTLAWAINRLKISDASRWRAPSGMVGSMGHFATGVVGAALARNGKVAALVGDGSMLMANEVSTAVHSGAPAIWVVLNDSRYNMCAQGASALGLTDVDWSLPDTDFAALARAMGAIGVSVRRSEDLGFALRFALAAAGPVVVDVCIDPMRPAPTEGRNAGLRRAGAKLH